MLKKVPLVFKLDTILLRDMLLLYELCLIKAHTNAELNYGRDKYLRREISCVRYFQNSSWWVRRSYTGKIRRKRRKRRSRHQDFYLHLNSRFHQHLKTHLHILYGTGLKWWDWGSVNWQIIRIHLKYIQGEREEL